jgi:dihydrofolate synthase / folylpolyglutamate synthase
VSSEPTNESTPRPPRVFQYPMTPDEAMTWLDGHVNMEKGAGMNDVAGVALPPRRLDPPSLDRMRALLRFLGDPQLDVPFIHLTGTNGKGSTARMAASLLMSSGRSVGTYTSPHLERLNERIALNGMAISNDDLADVLSDVALAEEATGEACSFFELTTAAAFRWFGDVAIEAAVMEVGMGGNWDATNAGDGAVAVVTNVELDHAEYFGPERADIAREKSGIIKPGSIALIGERDPDLARLLHELAQAREAEAVWQRGTDFDVVSNRLALAGRSLSLRTPTSKYTDVFVPLHGAHQGENAAIALAAVEAFLQEPLTETAVREGFARVVNPGRLEVVGRRPLTLIDGAHNPAGATVLRAALDDSFAACEKRVVVMGLLDGRDEQQMVDTICGGIELLVAVAPSSPRAMDPQRLKAAAEASGIRVVVARSVSDALAMGREHTGETDMLLVTGSLYLIGEARPLLVR